MTLVASVFHPYSGSESLRSDRSASDRQRHSQKVREAIRNNIVDLVGEEPIIGKQRDKIIKVPVRGVKEYCFIYGGNSLGVIQGNGDSQPGQVIGEKHKGKQEPGQGNGGDQPGVDYDETDTTLEEMIEIMFEDLELPDMERRGLRQVMSERTSKCHGRHEVGIRPRLNQTTEHWDSVTHVEKTQAVRSERSRASGEVEEHAGHESAGLRLRCAPLRPNGDGINRE